MLFNSPEFIFAFLPIVFVGFFVVARFDRTAAALWLGAASLFFYGWWSVAYVPLLLGSIGFNYFAGRSLARAAADGRPRLSLGLAVTANLLLLGYFKYADFFIGSVDRVAGTQVFDLLHVVLPIGISFYTFTQIAFLVDCARGKASEPRFVHYLLFVTYFPHLIAGPILHHAQMMPQFANPAIYRIDPVKLLAGATIFGVGLAKKILIADSLADFVAPVFHAAGTGVPIGLIDGWAGAIAYTLQLYFDFSGYSDMAIGLSLLFGVTLPANFNSPYKSLDIIDFWRRWHMSLSTFLRDYLYIPLGGNRLGEGRRYLNLFTTMVLGGLWHGASLTFVLWGAAHGLLLTINHLWRQSGLASPTPGRIRRAAGWALTFVAVVLAWVVFRAESGREAWAIYRGMAGLNGATLPAQIAGLIPGAGGWLRTVGNMQTLGAGTVMGVFEQLTLIAVALGIALFGRQTVAMSTGARLTVIAVSAGFIVNSLFFDAPKQFMYFQF